MTDIHALAGAYVLDAVSDTERAAFTGHLARCGACAEEVTELREAVSRLADPAWSVPPPRLRQQVLAQARRTRQLGPRGGDHRDETAAPSRWGQRLLAAAAAVVLAAGVGAGVWMVQEQRVREQRASAVAARAEADRVRAVLAAPDAVLHSAKVSGGGRVTLVSSASMDAGVVLLGGAPAPGRDRAYQLWLLRAGRPTDAGVLPPGAAGATRLIDGVRGADGLGVTVEPAGGSRTPTLPIVATVPAG
jgi:anti-sigma-K factor RskA